MLKKFTMQDKIIIAMIIVCIIMNVISYPFLNANIAIHFNASGKANGYIPKLGFIFLMPVFIGVIYLFYKFVKRLEDFKATMVSAILLVINIVTLVFSLR